MNICPNQSFQHNFTQIVTNSLPIDNGNFSLILRMLIEMVQHQFRRHYIYGADFMLSSLQQRNTTFGKHETELLIKHMHTPVIYAYTLLGAIIFSIFAIPWVCCFGICMRRSYCLTKYQFCFCIEGFLFVITCMLLTIGIGSIWQTSVLISKMLREYPNLTKDVVTDLHIHRMKLESDVNDLHQDVSNSLHCVSYIVNTISKTAVDEYRRGFYPQLDAMMAKVNDASSSALKSFGKAEIEKFSKIKEGKDEFHTLTEEFNSNVQHVKAKIKAIPRAKMAPLQRMLRILDLTQESLQAFGVTKWKRITQNMDLIFNTLIPEANASLHFNELQVNLRQKFEDEINKIGRLLNEYQENASQAKNNVSKALEVMLPNEIQGAVINVTRILDVHVSLMKLSHFSASNCPYWHGATWTLLFPGLHAMLVLGILFLACLYSCKELKRLSDLTWFNPNLEPHCSMIMFRLAAIIAIGLLWATLTMTLMFFLIHLPLAVFCYPFSNHEIFDQYIDKPTVWNNNTWLGSKLDVFLPKHESYLNVKYMLHKCSANRTLYYSLRMNEYWNIRKSFNLSRINLNATVLQSIFENSLPDMSALQTKTIEAITSNIKTIVTDLKPVDHAIENLKALKNIIETNEGRSALESRDMLRIFNVSNRTLTKMEYLKTFGESLDNVRVLCEGIIKTISSKNPNESSEYARNYLISTIFSKAQNETSDILNTTMEHLERSIKFNIGNCQILYNVYKTFDAKVCKDGVLLVTAYWISLAFTSVSLSLCLLLSCRISGYIQGMKDRYWQQILTHQRYQQFMHISQAISQQNIDQELPSKSKKVVIESQQ